MARCGEKKSKKSENFARTLFVGKIGLCELECVNSYRGFIKLPVHLCCFLSIGALPYSLGESGGHVALKKFFFIKMWLFCIN